MRSQLRHLKHPTHHKSDGQRVAGLTADDRRGSVLLVVIGLLGMLLLLGIAFYTFSTQEQASSQYYSEAAKEDNSSLSTDKLWAFALDQLILGTNDTNKQHSALWGRRHALLAGILGRSGTTAFDGFDLTPFNGAGINLKYSSAMGSVGDPYFDQNFNGVDDYADTPAATVNLLNFNYSAAANGGTAVTPPTYPAPDVDYTAPDINSLPLAFIGKGIDQNGTDVSVIMPSFHRPQLLRSGGVPIAGWQTAASTAQRVLRPHPSHNALAYNSTNQTWYTSPGNLPRFLSVAGVNSLGQTVNPFPFNPGTMSQGVWDLATAPVGTPTYSWDVDGDGDGTKEGIWMDLNYPVQSLSDGRKYVPLFSFTVTDADGLLNLNLSGNQIGMTNAGLPLAGGRHISRSNQGLSRAEISPQWALHADPATASAGQLTQHGVFWNVDPSAISRTEMANTEALFLNMGRPDFTDIPTGTYTMPVMGSSKYEPTKYYSGRYGELLLMGPNTYTGGNGIAGYGDGAASRDLSILPQAGRNNQMYGSAMNPFAGDDDSDGLFGQSRTDNAGYFFMGTSFLSNQSNVAVPSFIHPLDFWGDGVETVSSATGLRRQLAQSGGSPMQWPYYSYGFSSPGTDSTGAGYINYLNAAGGNLLPNSRNGQIDEADEIIAEWELATSNTTMQQDDIFGADNMFELHATNSDLTTTTLQARVRDLAPYNFKLSGQAEAIRRQYTVISHDRKQFGMSPYVRRAWEFNTDADGDSNYEFPPSFIGPAYNGTAANEPFRQVLRQLLYVEYNQGTAATSLAQLRLNLNRLLYNFDTTNAPIGAPVYRDLTSHPQSGLSNTPITAFTWNADAPSGTPSVNDQEWWARYDRQRMARDIYVLLYSLGGGRDDQNHTNVSNAGFGLFSRAQLQEMAQFAVNVVDELDRDDVITKFEYDVDLQTGWNLDDNAYTNDITGDRAAVYGVEAQRLTLSEVLGIISRQVKDSSNNPVDHAATQVKDDAADRFYTWIELRNASPFSENLGSGAWQIAVVDSIDPDGMANSGDEYDQDRVQLTPVSGNVVPGGLFTIGTRGGPPAADLVISTNNLPSVMKVESTGSGSTAFGASTIIAPISGTLDLDLIPTTGSVNNTALFRLTNGAGSIVGAGADVTTAGNFLFGGAGGNVSAAQETSSTTFVLRRRSNRNRAMPVSYTSNNTNHVNESNDNPWVEVDRIVMPTWRSFGLADGDGAAQVQAKLLPLTSYERAQPYSRNLQEASHAAATVAPYQAHTVGALNSNSPAVFSQVQLHFDRDFASSVDLLAVPLYGPEDVTRRVGMATRFDNSVNSSLLAQERFLRPQHYDNLSAGISPNTIPSAVTAATDILNNRWYRLMELIEIPTQSEQGMRTYPYALRATGAVNLNTIRTRGVLAGVVDDPDNPNSAMTIDGHHNPQYASEGVMLYDMYEGGGAAGRDWWLQFLRSRDGSDPITGLILPGTPQGRPFRSLNFVEHSSSSLDDTVLRSLPLDVANSMSVGNTADRRMLFEARTSSDRTSVGGPDAIDPLTRHRLLRKVVNNSTTRSNVFIVWITTRNFEAIVQPTTGEVQIGDALTTTADHRGFFVIDRSLPETAYNSNYGLFDYRKFVQYRKTLQ